MIRVSFLRLVGVATMLMMLATVMVPTAAASAIPGVSSSSSNDKQAQAPAKPVDYQALADMLSDPKARQALIDQLQELARQPGEKPQGKAPSESADASIAGHLASATTGLFGNVRHGFHSIAATAKRFYTRDGSLIDWQALPDAATRLGGLALAAYALFWLAGMIVRRFMGRLDAWARKAKKSRQLLRMLVTLTLVAAVWSLVIGGIYLLGNALVLLMSPADSEPRYLALFLNAFFIIELSRLALKLVLTPHYPGLRLLPVPHSLARYAAHWASVLLWTVGYATLFLVPVLRDGVDVDAARTLLWLVSLFALLYTVFKILRRRREVAKLLNQAARNRKSGMSSWLLTVLSDSWHLWAIAYFAMVFVVSVTRPEDAFPFVARATGLSLLAIGGGVLASALLGQLAGNRIQLSERRRRRMPLLERRLNIYLPLLLRGIRFLLLAVVLAGLMSIWHLASPFVWLTTDRGQLFLGTSIDILLIVLLALVSWLVIASMIEAKLNAETDHMPSARVQTLLTLFRNAVAIALSTVTAMIVLSELGVNIGPLLAGAGVLGLAIGFGAQKLVQDVITGIFIQLENAINTGDIIKVGGISGTVERLSIRSVGIRDLEGTFHIVPFSSVDLVSNYMRDFAYHKGEYGIAYRENIDEAIVQLRAAFDELYNDPDWQPKILEPILIPGVTALADSSVNIRAMIKTTPGDQWAVGRAYNRLVKMYFDAAGIEIPFPHTTVYFGIDKDGTSPPANLRLYRGGNLPERGPEPSAHGVTIPDPSNRPEERVPSQGDVDGGEMH